MLAGQRMPLRLLSQELSVSVADLTRTLKSLGQRLPRGQEAADYEMSAEEVEMVAGEHGHAFRLVERIVRLLARGGARRPGLTPRACRLRTGCAPSCQKTSVGSPVAPRW